MTKAEMHDRWSRFVRAFGREIAQTLVHAWLKRGVAQYAVATIETA
jgi:hypothetical protein